MRVRVRGPTGQTVHSLPVSATIGDLQNVIAEQTSLQSFDIKYGYPPKPLDLHSHDKATKLSELSVRLDGEQLIVSQSLVVPSGHMPASVQQEATHPRFPTNNSTKAQSRISQDAISTQEPSTFSCNNLKKSPSPASVTPQKPSSLSRKQTTKEMDPPELAVPTHEATMILRIMPDDNSCLFRAFNTAFFGSDMDNVVELRSIIAQCIQADPNTYSAAVLDQKPDDYCRWIQTSDAWGGSIELGILSKHFDIEICSIDVQRVRVDYYNQGMATRCILVYSGIHYDTIALSPSVPPYEHAYGPPENDVKVFNAMDGLILDSAKALCRTLQERHYYTDTAGLSVRCIDCGFTGKGQKDATKHAMETGHENFGENET